MEDGGGGRYRVVGGGRSGWGWEKSLPPGRHAEYGLSSSAAAAAAARHASSSSEQASASQQQRRDSGRRSGRCRPATVSASGPRAQPQDHSTQAPPAKPNQTHRPHAARCKPSLPTSTAPYSCSTPFVRSRPSPLLSPLHSGRVVATVDLVPAFGPRAASAAVSSAAY